MIRFASHWTTGSEGFSIALLLLAATPYLVVGAVGLWVVRKLLRRSGGDDGGIEPDRDRSAP